MSCETMIGSIVALLDGELAGAEREALDRHLAGCAACRRELADVRRTRDLVDRSLAALGAGVGRTSFEQLWARARDGETDGRARAPAGPRRPGRVARRRILWAGAGGLALAASLALMLVGVPREPGIEPGPAPATKASEVVARAPAAPSGPKPAAPVVVAAKPALATERVAPGEVRDDDADLDDDVEPVELAADEAAVVANEIDPPRELLERPDLFLNYPIVRKLDELQHLESVLADSPDPAADAGGAG